MKFFTPEWDFASRRASLGFGLRADKRAIVFDEAFYHRVYQEVYEREYDLMKGVHETSYLDLIMRMHKPLYDMGVISLEDYEATIEKARRIDAEKSPFIEGDVTVQCQTRLQNAQKCYQRLLPAEILDRVADIRVLAAGVASPEVFEAIETYAEENNGLFHQMHEAHSEHIDSIWSKIPGEIRENLFSLHDATLERAQRDEHSLTLFIKQDKENYYRIRTITFWDCEILHIDEPLDGGWWKYVEFDILEDGRYAVGILLNGEVQDEEGDWPRQTIEVRSPRITFVRDEFTEEEKQAQKAIRERIKRLKQEGLVKCIPLRRDENE